MDHILVVTPRPQQADTLTGCLEAHGYSPRTATTLGDALLQLSTSAPAAVIAHLALPDADGTETVRRMRARTDAPILAIADQTTVTDTVRVMDMGADDHLTQPFASEELLARLRAALRRPVLAHSSRTELRIGAFTLDLRTAAVTGPDGPVGVTPTEWRILALLATHPGMLIPGRRILREVWGPGHEDKTNYLRVYFTGLRRKLETDPAHPKHLLTEPGRGYRLQPGPD